MRNEGKHIVIECRNLNLFSTFVCIIKHTHVGLLWQGLRFIQSLSQWH